LEAKLGQKQAALQAQVCRVGAQNVYGWWLLIWNRDRTLYACVWHLPTSAVIHQVILCVRMYCY
jgi:hypothetical protein